MRDAGWQTVAPRGEDELSPGHFERLAAIGLIWQSRFGFAHPEASGRYPEKALLPCRVNHRLTAGRIPEVVVIATVLMAIPA